MSLCSTLLKSNNNCSYKAKYELLEHNQFYCKRHALSNSNELLGTNYSSIEDVPNLLPIECISRITPDDISTIFREIKTIFGLSLGLISQEAKTNSSTNLYTGDITNMLEPQYIVKVVKQLSAINRYSNGSSIYASILSSIDEPICVPIESREINNNLCLIRGSKYNTWYYEVIRPTYQLLGTNCKKLILRLVKLIETAQKNRIVHGSIELRNLSQLRENSISSTVFTSLRNAMFWVDRYGNMVESSATIDKSIVFDTLVCSRRLQQKHYPGRHDDYESLLYLTQHLLGKRLPWIGLDTNIAIVQCKEQYLNDLLYSDEHAGSIAKIILSSHFGDLPKYSEIYSAFEHLFI